MFPFGIFTEINITSIQCKDKSDALPFTKLMQPVISELLIGSSLQSNTSEVQKNAFTFYIILRGQKKYYI